MTDDLKWEFREPFTPVQAREMIDREGLDVTVQAYLTTERQLRQMFADWLADHRGFGNRHLRARRRQEIAALKEEIARRIILLHVVNDALYGRVS